MKPVDVCRIRSFNRPTGPLFRAYNYFVSARLGMTLMVPVSLVSGRLDPVVDQCPVPWLEATAVISVPYEGAPRLNCPKLIHQLKEIRTGRENDLGRFARDAIQAFIGEGGIYLLDQEWRHAQIYLSKGCEPSRLLIGRNGVRFAFTPDFLEGIL